MKKSSQKTINRRSDSHHPVKLPKCNIKDFVESLTSQMHLEYDFNELDKLGNAISNLADNDIMVDETKNRLLALNRAGVLNHRQMLKLLAIHLVETKNKN